MGPGFVINKFRGDPALLGDALSDLERRTGRPTLGVLPFAEGLTLDAEDSLALARTQRGPAGHRDPGIARGPEKDPLDIVVVRFPHISNFTDVDALAVEPSILCGSWTHRTRSGNRTWWSCPGRGRRSRIWPGCGRGRFRKALAELREDGAGGIRRSIPR